MGQTRVDLLHLLEDLRDAYGFAGVGIKLGLLASELDSTGGRRYLQALAQADGPCLQEAACDLELWALLGEGERHLSALLSLPLRTTSRTIGLAVLYFLEDDPLPTPAALDRLELLASVFAAPLATAAPAEASVPSEALVPVLAEAS